MLSVALYGKNDLPLPTLRANRPVKESAKENMRSNAAKLRR